MEGESAASTVIDGATPLSLCHRGAVVQKYKTAVAIKKAPPMRSLVVFFFMFHSLTSIHDTSTPNRMCPGTNPLHTRST